MSLHTPTEIARPPHPGTQQASALACATCPADCIEVCFNDAIRRVDTAVMIDAACCAGCGACAGACRHEYIVLADGFARLSPP